MVAFTQNGVGAMKPSELIRLAMTDLVKCEADDRFKIEMDTWHEYDEEDNVCKVCLAGSVMAQTLGAERTRDHDPFDMDEWTERLEALEEFRTGDVDDGLEYMEIEDAGLNRKVTDYHEDPVAFKADMGRLADDLEKAGL